MQIINKIVIFYN